MKMDIDKLNAILAAHLKWLKNESNGIRANLIRANLMGANLMDANLMGANLMGANLIRANLMDANLMDANLPKTAILAEGELIGYKKLANGCICKVKILSETPRLNSIGSRKCRAESVLVLEGEGNSQNPSGKGDILHYATGLTVKCTNPFCDDIRLECASGIHFFITKQEAIDL